MGGGGATDYSTGEEQPGKGEQPGGGLREDQEIHSSAIYPEWYKKKEESERKSASLTLTH